ncbi:MAG: hypothetical protein JO317_09490, partial [Verrucomicrobiae bacterium]|nr:hypothetical protein [Verrucomicrobiae bacterium]
ALKRGGFVGVFVDQHAGDHGKWVPFFNKLASTSVLPVVLQGHSNAAMIPVYCEAKTEGGWRVEFGPEIASCRDEGETLHRIHLALEKKILENPALYFWLHNRWKVPKRHIFFYHYRRGFYWPPGHDLQRFRILVRCTNWLGDAVLTIPALRAIKIARPDCHVTLMAPPDLLEFWKGQYYLDAVVPPEELQDSEFDLGIVFPNSMRAFLELYQNEVDTIVGYAGDFPRRFMLDVVVPDRCRAGFREHDVYDFLGLVDYLGAGTAKQVPEYTISKTLGKDEKTIAMHMGASYGPAKRWGEERFVELAKRFPDYRWVLIGAPDEDDVNRQAATQIGRNAIVARTKLDELGKLLARSRCLVCNDSGPMHFAAAVGTPVVAVFGSTEPSLTGPLGEGHEIVREKVECSPCFLRECPIDLRCMNGVSVDAVERALRRVLSRTSSVGKN